MATWTKTAPSGLGDKSTWTLIDTSNYTESNVFVGTSTAYQYRLLGDQLVIIIAITTARGQGWTVNPSVVYKPDQYNFIMKITPSGQSATTYTFNAKDEFPGTNTVGPTNGGPKYWYLTVSATSSQSITLQHGVVEEAGSGKFQGNTKTFSALKMKTAQLWYKLSSGKYVKAQMYTKQGTKYTPGYLWVKKDGKYRQ